MLLCTSLRNWRILCQFYSIFSRFYIIDYATDWCTIIWLYVGRTPVRRYQSDFLFMGLTKGKLEYQPRHRVPVVTVGWKYLIVVNEEGTTSVSPQTGASPLRKGMADLNITISDYLLSSPWHCNILFYSSI